MAARAKQAAGSKSASRKKASGRKKTTSTGRGGSRRSKAQMGVLERLESELSPTLQGFSRKLNAALTRLETQIDRGQAAYRKRAARTLRDASRKLGRLESQGEQGWKKLDKKARKEAAGLLEKVEKAVETSGPAAGRAPRKAARKATRKTQRAMRSAASRLEP
jgi:hypothetical protein